ncbi:HPF/RaiA family ribosome-associated protein [Chlorobium sp. N1]|uniref:HPF/RaiA family ribosome-associated protein n=1 Tax=Chlorobium sp. N1 TaxID=2491138 RepID=UPI00103F1105|nr:HPF/RaiA family ribosome-associated protein [Chlorobium sp. N1]TCD48750.1 ribosome-associated translation inhibitor RaiA [Chlorobium sp. N1]
MTKDTGSDTPMINVTLRHSNNHNAIEDYARSAVQSLTRLYPSIISCHVILDHQKNDYEKNKNAEITLHVPQHDFIAKESGAAYELCIDGCVAALGRQLQKYKEKIH